MAILPATQERYIAFGRELLAALETFTSSDEIIWHYTRGPALIDIIETGSIFATQLSCLNDTTELRYGSSLLRAGLVSVREGSKNNPNSLELIEAAIDYFTENTKFPAQYIVPFFVTCFSEVKDDLSQWRAYGGGENGYAIGFRLKELAEALRGYNDCIVARVNYNVNLHGKIARRAAEKTIEFFLEATERTTPPARLERGREFLEAWGGILPVVAPAMKDPAFSAEREVRVIKGFQAGDLKSLQFRQKQGLMSRHLPLRLGERLPIAEIMVGPCRRPGISRTTVDTLLRKNGYAPDLVSISAIPFQVS